MIFYSFFEIVVKESAVHRKIGKIYLRHLIKSNKIIGDEEASRQEENNDFTDSFTTYGI